MLALSSSKAMPNLFKNNMQMTTDTDDKSFRLPNFESVKIELVKTNKGEIKEKPAALTKELEKNDFHELTQYNLDNHKNSFKIQNLLNYKPENIHRKASHGMILPPKPEKQTHSILDILGTVESPSHWRYFQNKVLSKYSFDQ